MKAKKNPGKETQEKRNENKSVSEDEVSQPIAAIRIRGSVNTRKALSDTLDMLGLRRINNCVILPNNKPSKGMLKKAESFLTWGEIDKDTLEKLVYKRARLQGGKRPERAKTKSIAGNITKNCTLKYAGIKPVFRLTPPSKGHRPVKRLYPKGACGYRGKQINELLNRML